MMIAVKICGVKTPEAVKAASHAGATHLGFNFFQASPRYVAPPRAYELAMLAPGLKSVALTVDAENALLDAIVSQARPHTLQLHGSETPQRINEIRTRYRLPVIKAVAIECAADVQRAHDFEPVADFLLFDAKPAGLPGGNGLAFDWQLLAEAKWAKPWLLSGGLNPANVADAIRITRATGVDVSSGVEKSRGEKDAALIEEFVSTARSAFAGNLEQ